MESVQIIVSGPAGSGKSSVAQAIARMLHYSHGANVVVHDDEEEPPGELAATAKARMQTVVLRSMDAPITIKTQNTHAHT